MKALFILSLLSFYLYSEELEEVSIRLTWKHNFTFAGIYAAYEKGFYKDVGLNVTIVPYTYKTDLFDDIESGKHTYSMMTSDVMLFQHEGKKLVNLASYLKRNILVLITKPHIKKVEDLKNYKIISSEAIFKTAIYVLLNQHGLKKEDIQLFKRNHNNYLQDFLSNDTIGAITGYLTNQVYDFRKNNIHVNIINPSEYGVHNYGLNLFTSEKEFKNNQDRVQKFVKATNKGWEYAFKNKEEIIDIIYNKYSKIRSKEALRFEAQELEKLFQLNIYKIGELQPELQNINLNLYKKLDLIENDWYPENYPFYQRYKKHLSLNLFYLFIGVVFLLVAIFIYRSYILNILNNKLQKEIDSEIKKRIQHNKMLYHNNKMVSMGEMINYIAHQWREPLAQINSTVFKIDEEINNHNFNKKVIDKKLSDIELFTHYMSTTIEDFSKFTKEDKQKINFNLLQSVDETLKILDNIIKKYNLNITLDISDNIFLNGFKSEFQQIFLIFINNSKDAFILNNIKNRDIKIITKEKENIIYLNIYDNAGGIKEEILPKIFLPYYTSKKNGTGIGLNIAKMIIEESMQGQLSINNSKNGICIQIIIKKEETNGI